MSREQLSRKVKHGPLEVRFWQGVTRGAPDECWEWQRYCCKSTGYGRIAGPDGYKKIGAHRASWMIHFGEIPDGLSVLHTCDNRPCVNPKHLFLGTDLDNNRDMRAKGRGVDPPRPAPGRTLEEQREVNKLRMGKSKTHCKRGHLLPPYQEGRTRRCMELECREVWRYNALGSVR